MRFAAVLLVALTLLLAAACSDAGTSLDEPPEIRLGEEICDQCNMIISDMRFASAYKTTDGEARRFDDIGGMAIYHNIRREDVTAFWVHDVDSVEWLNVEEAWFVHADEIMSPMGHGLAAYSSENRAREAAAEIDGHVLRWEDVLTGAEDEDGH